MNIKEFSTNLQKLYGEMSDRFSSYQSSTGWNCLSSCGRCCLNPDIEASMYEMIPMAFSIYEEGLLDEWLAKLESPAQAHCLNYVPGEKEGQGKCGRYQYRPSVCRMFGVAGFKNKNEEITLSICKFIREEFSISEVPSNLSRDTTPLIVDWSYRLSTLDQKLIQDKRPLNEALKLALEKVAFYAQYQSQSSDT